MAAMAAAAAAAGASAPAVDGATAGGDPHNGTSDRSDAAADSAAALAALDDNVHPDDGRTANRPRMQKAKQEEQDPELQAQEAAPPPPHGTKWSSKPPLPPVRRSARGSKGAVAAAAAEPAAKSGAAGSAGPGQDAKQASVARADSSPAPVVLDLDRIREEVMERNRRKLMELQLPGLVAGLATAAAAVGGGGGAGTTKPSQRGVGNKRQRESSNEPPPPRRVSLRVRGVAADSLLAAGIDVETAAGVQLVAGMPAVAAATGRAPGQPEAPKPRHPEGELPFRSENGEEASDAAFLKALKAAANAAAPAPVDAGTDADGPAGRQQRRSGSTGYTRRGAGGEALTRLGLVERDVAKVTKDGVTHLAWLPGSDRILLAAADKSGKVALWDVDGGEDGPAADSDGVLLFSPHGEYVSGLRWLGRDAAVGPCRLITAAYDGSLRALDLGGAGTWLQLPAPGDPREAEFSALDVSPDGRTAYLGDPLGNLDIVDLRAPSGPGSGARVAAGPGAESGAGTGGGQRPSGDWASGGSGQRAQLQEGEGQPQEMREEGGGKLTAAVAAAVGPVGGLHLCDRKINTLHLEPSAGSPLLASSASDGTVCIWDLRRLGAAAQPAGGSGGAKGGHHAKALSVLRHGKSCHAAYWAPDGSRRLLSTSYDDTIRIWADPASGPEANGSRHAQSLSIPHNNQTGRWITPFRAVWSAACDAVLVGNMRRGLDVFSAPGPEGTQACGAGKLLQTLASDNMTAIPSRACCHPSLPVLVAATSSGRCHVWR
ncbi:hypothetical protein GPECTOR_17g892 [Gonium pectorale]|uniref:Uncharacterized protein n=1 Tax=Gonium pectorale TaxID=33097 RepID=A0A150GKE0_GONPE|nr:hypothetical protein GPECTOR_17g892 [Gonium pectorale]|eukprot:KXZ50254.1 hypothetical protein GPECTOR_17g892 [Gonium pectorale]